MFEDQYKGKKVLVTGHTGFKGSWLSLWLTRLNARVYGIALDPIPVDQGKSFYDSLHISDHFEKDIRLNINDADSLAAEIKQIKPDFIFHLAAQPLVRESYEIPLDTMQTNFMGTVHVLEAVRQLENDCVCICITTDKCYENKEWLFAYRENEAMGGHDPYSASKGAAEIAISSYRRSFCSSSPYRKVITSVRAGNVIGGGDWSKDRIIPDCFRALAICCPINVRNKIATRPWQHVLEPLSGYLWLGACISEPKLIGGELTDSLLEGMNFGPLLDSNKTVSELVEELLKHTDGEWIDDSDPNAPHEASKLNLSIEKAFHLLSWKPVWDFSQTVEMVAKWYLKDENRNDSFEFTAEQIRQYVEAAEKMGLEWV